MDWLKFKLKFGLRPYFFYFSLPLFKTLTSDSLFLTLFHLNIHSFFIFLLFPLKFFFFLQLSKYLLFSFSSSLPLCFRYISSPSLFFFFFFFFFTTTHVPLLFSFLFFPTTHVPPPFLFTSLPQQLQQLHQPRNFSKKKSANLQTFTAILRKNIKTRPAHQSKITHKPSPSLIWRRRRRSSKRSRGKRRKRRERDGSKTSWFHGFDSHRADRRKKKRKRKEQNRRQNNKKMKWQMNNARHKWLATVAKTHFG